MSSILKSLLASMIAAMSPLCLLSDDAKPAVGNDWKIPGIGMEFIWIKELNCWVGKYEVTNSEYRKFKPEHDSRYYKGYSLNAERQPVVFVTFLDATAYAKWLTDRENSNGRIPDGYGYRLPTEKEWTEFCQCGDSREYPWGSEMPPKYGNYCGEETNGITDKIISGYNDGFAVTCPVEKSGRNDWGLYGVGGNVWECTIRSSSDFYFDAWRGAAWCDFYPGALTSKSRLDHIAPYRAFNGGFRLVLTRLVSS